VEFGDRLVRVLSVRKMRQSAFDTGLREYRIEAGGVRVVPLAESEAEVVAGIAARERRTVRQNRRG
jgi:KaiC/GvpD/RAD55 family RecA-like ATPase